MPPALLTIQVWDKKLGEITANRAEGQRVIYKTMGGILVVVIIAQNLREFQEIILGCFPVIQKGSRRSFMSISCDLKEFQDTVHGCFLLFERDQEPLQHLESYRNAG